MKKKQKIIIKNMISLSDVLADAFDERNKKLSDKYENLKLSHNRMRNLLKLALKVLENPFTLEDVAYIHKRITLELYGLENYKGVKK